MLVSPTRARSRVVLPAPLGPESATRSRRSTLNETLSNSGSPLSSLRRFDAITTAIGCKGTAVTRVLAIDVGTSSARAQIFDAGAAERDPARRNYSGETDPARIVTLVREAVDEAVG